ncbi:MAG TPA: acetolactate synthase small subunit [Candidatus Binatia bacterium]|nr:acetolactate synthase small subunit [Candidatus Binatia bacterium]
MSHADRTAPQTRHVVSALVVDRPGTLNRVASLLRARSFNIDSLTVGSTQEAGRSRMTIVVRGDEAHTHQVIAQLERLVDVLEVTDLTHRPRLELELALAEVEPPSGPKAEAAVREAMAQAGGELLATNPDGWRLRLADTPDRIEGALQILRRAGLRSLVRAGSVAMAIGAATSSEPTAPQLGDSSA